MSPNELRPRALNSDDIRSAEIFELVNRSLSEVFWLFDLDTLQPIFVSDAFESILRVSVTELMKQPSMLLELVHPEDSAEVHRHLKRARLGGVLDLCCRIKRSNGTYRTLSLKARRIRPSFAANPCMFGVARDITDNATASGSSSLAVRYEALFNRVEDAFWCLDDQGTSLFLNAAMTKLLGYEHLDVIGRPILDFVVDSDRVGFAQWMGLDAGEKRLSKRFTFLAKDGSPIPLKVESSLMRGEETGGDPVSLVFISDQDQREGRERWHAFMRHVIEHIDVMALWALRGQKVIYANKATLEALGYGLPELRKLALADLLVDQHGDSLDGLSEPSIENRNANFEAWLKDHRGHRSPVAVDATWLAYEGVEYHCLLIRGIHRQIKAREKQGAYQLNLEKLVEQSTSQLRKTSQSLTDTEQRLQFALEASHTGIWELTSDTGDAYFSPVYQSMLGYEIGEIPPKIEAFEALLHPDDRDSALRNQSFLARDEEGFELDFRMRKKDGTYAWIHSCGRVFGRDANGNPLKIIGTHTDITLKREYERRLSEASRVAASSIKARDALISNLSHEVRTPLNAVLGLTHQIRSEAAGLEKVSIDRLGAIDEASMRLLKLFNDLVAYTDAQASSSAALFEPINFKGLVQDISDYAEVEGRRQGVRFTEVSTSNLTARLAGCRGDPERIKQVLLHLVDVALRNIGIDTLILHVNVIAETEGNVTLRFEINDRGPLLPREMVDTLLEFQDPLAYDPLRPLPNRATGLATARLLAEHFGGVVTIGSHDQGGNQYALTLELPRVSETDRSSEEDPIPQEDMRTRVERLLSGCSILLAEDDLINQTVLGNLLRSAGLVVEVVENGQEAVDRVLAQHFDLIFMDIRMPVMDGFTASRIIRNLPGGDTIPIIAVTANGVAPDNESYRLSRLDQIIEKPFTPEMIFGALLNQLGARFMTESSDAGADPGSVRGIDLKLDLEAGLARCAHNRDTFIKLLHHLVENPSYSVEGLIAMADQDAAQAKMKCHTLKGASALLGVEALRYAAEALEHAVRDGLRGNDLMDPVQRVEDCRQALSQQLPEIAAGILK